MNNEIGKFSQNNNEKLQTKLIVNVADLLEILENRQLIIHSAAILPNTETIMIQYHKKGEYEKLNRNFSCIIGAFITSHARIELHKTIVALHRGNCILLYVDTDSVMYMLKNGATNPLCNIHSMRLGAWKNELKPNEKIEKAVFVGPKNYVLHISSLKNGKRVCKRIVKIRGFNFRQALACQKLESDYMKQMVLERMQYPKPRRMRRQFPNGVKVLIPQSNIRAVNKVEPLLITQRWNKHYANNTIPKRAFIYRTLKKMEREGGLVPHGQIKKVKEEKKFINLMKYFTMPYGYSAGDIHLLRDKYKKCCL